MQGKNWVELRLRFESVSVWKAEESWTSGPPANSDSQTAQLSFIQLSNYVYFLLAITGEYTPRQPPQVIGISGRTSSLHKESVIVIDHYFTYLFYVSSYLFALS